MKIVRSPTKGAIAAGLSVLVLLAGCGSGGGQVGASQGSAGASGKSAKVFLAWADVTFSTLRSRAEYLPDMVTFADMAASDRAPLFADAFTAAPETTTSWPVQFDFSQVPQAFGGNGNLLDAYLRSKADQLRSGFVKLLRKSPLKVGSPLFNVFAVSAMTAASYPSQSVCLGVFTDGGVLEPDFQYFHVMSARQVSAFIARWKPRLLPLRGAKVYIAGVGRGTKITLGQLEYVHSVLQRLLAAVGARLVTFAPRMPSNARC